MQRFTRWSQDPANWRKATRHSHLQCAHTRLHFLVNTEEGNGHTLILEMTSIAKASQSLSKTTDAICKESSVAKQILFQTLKKSEGYLCMNYYTIACQYRLVRLGHRPVIHWCHTDDISPCDRGQYEQLKEKLSLFHR